MARAAKKETSLTTEEKLAKALVPEEEQPYPVPENWCWVRLGSLYEINPKNEASDELEAGFVPMEKISAGMCTSFNFDVRPWGKAKKGHVQLANGDVAFAKISPCFENRKSMIVNGLPNGIGAGTTEIIVLRQPSVNNRFTFWLISTDDFIQKGRRTYSGTVGQQRISMDYVRQYPIPLPPLPEQQRIVTFIESLFADLDAAKEKLQTVLDGFAERRAAILHQAFAGELTREWREENGIPAKSWSKRKLGEIGHLERGRSKHRPRNDPKLFGGSYPFIQTGDIAASGMYVTTHKQTLSEVGLQQSRLFPAGTLCITIAANIGDVAILSYDCCFPDSVVGFTPNAKTISEYVYYMMTTLQQELETNAPATAQKNINLKLLNDTYVSVPTIKEQKEIVRILDNILAKESQSKAAVESALAKIDTMKKAILATAFRGGLGTGDENDESAVQLLRDTLESH